MNVRMLTRFSPRNALALLTTFLLPLPLLADTTYTYTGNPFFSVATSAPYTDSDFISGSFTVASPLAANLSSLSPDVITPESFTFTDGIDTDTNADAQDQVPNFSIFGTDSSGNITEWTIGFWFGSGSIFMSTIYGFGDSDAVFQTEGQGLNFADPGTWAMSTTSAPPDTAATPEPSSLLLLGTGILGFVAFSRLRFRNA